MSGLFDDLIAPTGSAGLFDDLIEKPQGTYRPAQDSQKSQEAYVKRQAEINPAPRSTLEAASDGFSSFGASVNNTLKTVTDLAGTNNPVSNFLDDNAKSWQGGYSPAYRAELLKQEEEKAALGADASYAARAALAAKQVIRNPIEGFGELAGNIAPMAVGGAAGLGVKGMTALSAAMGAGAVKGGIAETIQNAPESALMTDPMYARLRQEGASEQDAKTKLSEQRASYGEAYGKILLGGGIGALVGKFGSVENALANMGKAGLAKEAVTDGIVKTIAKDIGKEVATEIPQEMTETYLGNKGAAQKGAAIAADQGVVESGVKAGILAAAGGGLAGVSNYNRPTVAPITEPTSQPAPTDEAAIAPTSTLRIGNTPDQLVTFPDGSTARRSEVEQYIGSLPEDQQDAARAKIAPITAVVSPDGDITLSENAEIARRNAPQKVIPTDILQTASVDDAISTFNDSLKGIGNEWQALGVSATGEASNISAYKTGQEWQDIAPDQTGSLEQQRLDIEREGAASSAERDARLAAIGRQFQDLGITQPADDLQAQRSGMRPFADNFQNPPESGNVSTTIGDGYTTATSAGPDGNNTAGSVVADAINRDGLGDDNAGRNVDGVDQRSELPSIGDAGTVDPVTQTVTQNTQGDYTSANDVQNTAPAADRQAEASPVETRADGTSQPTTVTGIPATGVPEPVQATGVKATEPFMRPADIMRNSIDAAAQELAMQVQNDSAEDDFSAKDVPQAISQWAKDANIPADDLRNAFKAEIEKRDFASKGDVLKSINPVAQAESVNPTPIEVKDVYGRTHRVLQSDIASGIDRIPTIRKNGDVVSGEEIPRSSIPLSIRSELSASPAQPASTANDATEPVAPRLSRADIPNDLRPDSTDQEMTDQIEADYQQGIKEDIKVRLGLVKPPEAEQTKTPFKAFLREYGVDPSHTSDIAGPNRFKANNVLPATFRKGGLGLDALVERAIERGFMQEGDRGDQNKIVSMIQSEIAGDVQVSSNMADADAQKQYERVQRMEIEGMADRMGLPYTADTDTDRLASMVNRIERYKALPKNKPGLLKADRVKENALALVARIERKRAQYEAESNGFAELEIAEQEALIDILTDAEGNPVTVSKAEMAAEAAWQEDQTQWNIQNEQANSTSNSATRQAETSAARVPEEGTGNAAEDGITAQSGSVEAQGQEELTLTSPTREDVIAQQDRAEKARKDDEKQATDAANKAKADAEVGAFNLTGSDRAADVGAANGQSSIFDEPKPAAEMTVQDHLRAAADKMDAEKAGKPVAETEKADKPESVLEAESSLWKRINDGTVTVDQFKAGFESWVNRKAEIVEALSKNKKDDLLKMGGAMFAYRNKSENKPEIVDSLWRDGANRYVLARSFSHGMGKNAWIDGVRRMVDNTDADQLAQYAQQVKANTEEAVSRVAKIAEAIKDPQTLDDYITLMRSTIRGGKTFKEARMMLTPEQRAKYDELAAADSRSKRKTTTDTQRSSVAVAGQLVDGNIIATKHTQKKHDLFVVQLAERVSKEDYDTLNSGAKRIGGYYSSYRGAGAVPGFTFTDRAQAEAFVKLAQGDNADAQAAAQANRDAFEDDRSQSATQRLTEMADRLEGMADASLNQERKANTNKRAQQAASAEAAANADKAMAKTMRNLAEAISNGTAKFLDRVRQKVQVAMLQGYVATAKGEELRAKYETYSEQERHKGEAPTIETADFAEFPTYTASRSNLASLARQLMEVDGSKLLGQKLLKEADDVTDAYLDFAKANLVKVSAFRARDGGLAAFGSKAAAEESIARSGYKGNAIAYQVKRGQHSVILSPSEAIERGIWQGDGDTRITLTPEIGAELVEKIGKAARRGAKVAVPWQLETAHDRRKALTRMGIETPAEFRAALREFIGLQEQAQAPNKVKELERAMVGRRNDGMDFFPTPESVADEMVTTAGIEPGMAVLEPSAGWGHIAERIRAAGVDPDVGEMSNDRRELLEAKGFNVVGRDFMEMSPRGFTYGDVFRHTDGRLGVLGSNGGLGSSRYKFIPVDGDGRNFDYVDRDELTGVEKRGSSSGYDRILMNPPFSDGRDIQHVQHAYTLLKPGGRIVAIMGESAFTNQNKRATEFREWLESVGGTEEKLAEGTFNDPSLPVNTGANARMVVIEKSSDTGIAMFATSKSPVTAVVDGRDVVALVDRVNASLDIPRVQSFATFDELPDNVQEAAENAGVLPQEFRGVTIGNMAYVIHGNHSSLADVESTILHELYGHIGIRKLFGTDVYSKLNAVYLSLGDKKIQQLVEKYKLEKNGYLEMAADVGANASQRFVDMAGGRQELRNYYIAEELLANIAENESGTLKQKALEAIGAIKSWLRKTGFVKLAALDMADIAYILKQSRIAAHLEVGDRSLDMPRFSKGESASNISPGEEFWRKIKADEPFTEQELKDAYSIGRRGTERAGRSISSGGTQSGSQDAAGRVFEWSGEIAGFSGYRTLGVESASGKYFVAATRSGSQINPGEVAKIVDESLIGYLFTDVGGKWQLDIVDPAPNTSAYKALEKTGRIEPTGQFYKDGSPYYRTKLDDRYTTNRTLMQEAVRRLAIHTGTVPTIVQAGRDTGARAGKDIGPREFGPDVIEAKFSRTKGSPHSWDAPEASRFDDLIYKLQDKNIDTKRVIDEIRKTGKDLADEKDAYLQEELFHGRAAARTEDFVNKELAPLISDMKMRGIDIATLDEYLHARHAQEANELVAERNPEMPDGGSGMTTQAAKDYLANLKPEERKRFEAVAAKVYAITAKTRKLYADYSLVSESKVKGWEDTFKYYVPLQRDDKSDSIGIGQGFSVKGKEVKSRTGSTRKVVDILANIAMERERAIVRGEKNRVSVALVGLVTSNPNEDFWQVGPPPMEKIFDPKTNSVVDRADPLWTSRNNVVMAKVKQPDGTVKEVGVVFNEENDRAMRMSESLKNLDASQLTNLWGVSATISRYFAAINTQYNPVFGVVNFVRDVQGALINLSTTPLKGHSKEVAGHTLSALKGIYLDARAARDGKTPTSAWAQLWEEFQDEGGQTGYRDMFANSADRAKAIEFELNPEKWMDSPLGKFFTANGTLKVPLSMAQKGATGIFGWLSDYNLAMENAVRLSAYKVALEQGMSKQQAASLGKNLTVNFNRKGQVGQQVGAVYAFFNASMQGSARLGKTLFDMDGSDVKSIRLSSTGKKIVYGGILLGTVQALALAAAGFDGDEPPDFVRERSLIIPTGGKTYITIPMPLGLHVLPNMGRIPTEFALGGFKKPGDHIVKLLGLTAGAFNPIGGGASLMQMISPTALDPMVALSENKDWTGKPIAKESYNKAEPGHLRVKDTASTPAKFISEAINTLSGGTKHTAGMFSPTPDQIDYLWGQATGGVGREIGKAQQSIAATISGEDLPIHKIPLVGRFYGDAENQSAQSTRFYSTLNRMNEHETEIKGLQKDKNREGLQSYLRENPEARLYEFANDAEKDVQKLRNFKRELMKLDAPKERISAIEDRIKLRMTQFNDAVAKRKEREKATAE